MSDQQEPPHSYPYPYSVSSKGIIASAGGRRVVSASTSQAGEWNRAWSTPISDEPASAPQKTPVSVPSKATGLKPYIPPDIDETIESTGQTGAALNANPSQPLIHRSLYGSMPLDSARKEIRVLELFSGAGDSPLEGTLRIISLLKDQEQSKYEALSYTWGAITKHEQIYLSDVPLPITDNLVIALRQLRLPDATRTLWVDAVCINQADLHEREQQVLIMREVYSNCEHVLIWLGLGLVRADTTRQQVIEDLFAEESILATLYADLDAAIGSGMMSDKWWGRAWTIQELAVAPKAYICLGAYQIRWGEFCYHLLHISSDATNQYSYKYIAESFKESRAQITDRFSVLESLRHYRNTITPILSALRVLLPADATNPRDKVFSMLGLLDSRYVGIVPPRYSCSIVGLFARTTHAIMQIERSLSVLLYRGVQFNRVLFQTRGLPSWTLEFTYEDSHYLKQIKDITDKAFAFDWKYGPDSPNTDLPDSIASLSDDLKVLTLSGYIFDEVDKVVPTHSRSRGEWSAELRSEIELLALTNLQQKRSVYDGLGTQAYTHEDKSHLAKFDDAFDRPLAKFRTARKDWGGSSNYWFLLEAFALWSTLVNFDLDEVERMKLMSDLNSYVPYADAVGGSAASVWSTKSGFLGISPWGVKPGDTIALVYGSGLPIVLHQQEDGFVFRGLAYLHGIMKGELLPLFERGVFERREFHLY